NASGGATMNGSFSSSTTRNLTPSRNSTSAASSSDRGTGSILNLTPNSTLSVTSDYPFYGANYGGPATVINNQGTFTKTAGTGSKIGRASCRESVAIKVLSGAFQHKHNGNSTDNIGSS